MKKAILLVAVVGILAVVVYGFRALGPRYEGQSAAKWIEQLHATNAVARHQAETAVRALGTNAIPLLVEKIQARDSSLRSNVTKVLRKQSLVPVPPSSATESRQDAVRGFEALGADSDAAVAALVRLLEDPRAADHASYALSQMHNRVIPALLIAVTNAGLQVRRRVIADLGLRHTNAPGVERALVERFLHDPDVATRSMAAISLGRTPNLSPSAIQVLIDALDDWTFFSVAIQALGEAGSNARPAVPMLKRVATDPGTFGAMGVVAARQALARIEPMVLGRLGITQVGPTNRYE